MTRFQAPHHLGAGWIELIAGPMFSGKTEELLRRVTRARIAKQQVQLFKAGIDGRYAQDAVASHAGRELAALPVHTAAELRQRLEAGVQVVAIDEVQFFDEAVVDLIQALADGGVRVIASGLDLDFRAEPFGFMPRLMALAEQVDKLTAICVRCGAPGTRSQRLLQGRPAGPEDPLIVVGAAEAYEARCRACHELHGSHLPASLRC